VEKLAFSPRETAEQLGVAVTTLYALLGTGQIRSLKVGRRRLIPAAEIARFLEEGPLPTPPAGSWT